MVRSEAARLIFELFAPGIDPPESTAAWPEPPGPHIKWPSREVVRAFAKEADRRVIEALLHADIEKPGHPLLDRSEAVFAILEHEEMHQETLRYMWHRLPFTHKTAPAGYVPRAEGVAAPAEWTRIPAGRATLGVDRTATPFGWDNECPACAVDVPGFRIERHDVTNERFLEFVDAGGYRDPRWWTADDWQWRQAEGLSHPLFWERVGEAWFWRGMFGLVPLPASWPVYVSLAEACAFARWRGARLPTESEFQRAAYGSPDCERAYPWGPEAPTPRRGVFDFASCDMIQRHCPAGSHGSPKAFQQVNREAGH